MSGSVIAHTEVRTLAAAVDVWKDDAGELTVHINGLAGTWHGLIGLGRELSTSPGRARAWIRTQVCEALCSAMGSYGLNAYMKTLVSTSSGCFDVCEMANAVLGAVGSWSGRRCHNLLPCSCGCEGSRV